MPTMPSNGPQAPLALIHRSPSILAFKPKSHGRACGTTNTLSAVSYIHSHDNEPMPRAPKRPLHQVGTNLCLVITICLQNCTRQSVTASCETHMVGSALKFAIHRYQARRNPCPNTGAMPLQVKRPHLARCQKAISTVSELAVRSLSGHGRIRAAPRRQAY